MTVLGDGLQQQSDPAEFEMQAPTPEQAVQADVALVRLLHVDSCRRAAQTPWSGRCTYRAGLHWPQLICRTPPSSADRVVGLLRQACSFDACSPFPPTQPPSSPRPSRRSYGFSSRANSAQPDNGEDGCCRSNQQRDPQRRNDSRRLDRVFLPHWHAPIDREGRRQGDLRRSSATRIRAGPVEGGNTLSLVRLLPASLRIARLASLTSPAVTTRHDRFQLWLPKHPPPPPPASIDDPSIGVLPLADCSLWSYMTYGSSLLRFPLYDGSENKTD